MDREDIIAAWAEEARRLLELERRAEIEETTRLRESLAPRELERRGLVFLGLRLEAYEAGLGGRLVLHLLAPQNKELRGGKISTGDIVSIRSMENEADLPLSGVVSRLERQRMSVVLDDDPEDFPDRQLRVDRVTNDVTYRRMNEGLAQLVRYKGGPADRLRRVLFEDREPEFDARAAEIDDHELSEDLDASQREAVRFAMSAMDLALIHGPPGTGKTTTLVEIIRQAVLRGERVLACAGSNVAVDNLVERLAARGHRVVRTGHPARLLPSVVDHCLDRLVERSDAARYSNEARRELERTLKRYDKARGRHERHLLRRELRDKRREIRELEQWAMRSVIESAEVVLATNIGAADPLLARYDFGLVVLDEAAQSVEAAAWLPILKGRRLVLAGDHCQLPPTIVSREAEREGLGLTLFERLARTRESDAGDRTLTRLLTVQYRMHERIMRWSSDVFYGGRVEAHASVKAHLLHDRPEVESLPETEAPLFFIDTAGAGFEEELEKGGTSRFNPGEARVVAAHVRRLIEAGLAPRDIAVITPYGAQVGELRRRLRQAYPELEIGTVDGFQGREKEAVVISAVRSNEKGEVGFLAEERRMNVAVTRARRHCALVADSATLARHDFLDRLLQHFQEEGEYRSAFEYADD